MGGKHPTHHLSNALFLIPGTGGWTLGCLSLVVLQGIVVGISEDKTGALYPLENSSKTLMDKVAL